MKRKRFSENYYQRRLNNRHGKLTIVEYDMQMVRFICVCDCGEVVYRNPEFLTCNSKVSSCGCIKGQQISRAKIKHGMTHTSEYKSWAKMKERCGNPNGQQYADYGGRGIQVCDRWVNDFNAFLEDMGYKPSPKHSLDRIDNSKGYSLENCRWATPQEQSNNRRSNVRYKGKTIAEWARHFNVKNYQLQYHIKKNGWKPAFDWAESQGAQ